MLLDLTVFDHFKTFFFFKFRFALHFNGARVYLALFASIFSVLWFLPPACLFLSFFFPPFFLKAVEWLVEVEILKVREYNQTWE